MRLHVRGRGLELRFRLASLRRYPLTVADLAQETAFLRGLGVRLRVTTRPRG